MQNPCAEDRKGFIMVILAVKDCLLLIQEDSQLGKAVDIAAAVNSMVHHLARANLAGVIQKLQHNSAASAINIQFE